MVDGVRRVGTNPVPARRRYHEHDGSAGAGGHEVRPDTVSRILPPVSGKLPSPNVGGGGYSISRAAMSGRYQAPGKVIRSMPA